MNSMHPIKLAINVLLAVVALVAIAGFSALFLKGGKLLSVQSGSMHPAIPKGSLVVVNDVPHSQIGVGDVITYRSTTDKTMSITHRVSALLVGDSSGNSIVTKGDANAEADVPIEASSVIGKVGLSIPYLGYGIDFIKQPLGLILIIYIPAMIVIMNEMKKLIAYYRRMQPYRLYIKRPHHNIRLGMFAVLGTLMLGFSALTTGVAWAELQNQATLTGNTISGDAVDVPPVEPPVEPPTEQPGGGTNITCTNNTDVNVQSTTNQSATSGSANVSNNTNGGSATSGSASNSSSTSFGVTVNNGSCVPPAEPVTPTPTTQTP